MRFPFDEAALLIALLYSLLKSLCIYSKANSCRTCLNVKSQAETYPREQPLQFCTQISKSFCHNIPNTFIKPTDLADCSISIFHDVNLRSILSRCCTGRRTFLILKQQVSCSKTTDCKIIKAAFKIYLHRKKPRSSHPVYSLVVCTFSYIDNYPPLVQLKS